MMAPIDWIQLTMTAVQLVLAFSGISSCILSLFTFCLRNKMPEIILKREAPNFTQPVSIALD